MMHSVALGWDDLQAFLCVCRTGSFVHAARELGVEHTTVARRVTRLEDCLGTTLLHRGSRGVKLTAAGKELAASLARTETEVGAATRLAAEQDGRISGTVRIATAEIFAVAFLCARLVELERRYPSLQVQLLTGQAPIDLSKGEADLAVRMFPPGTAPAEADVLARKLGGFDFALYGSRAYLSDRPLRPDQPLRGHALIGYAGLSRSPGEAWLSKRAEGARVALLVNSVPVATAAAVAGLGLAVLPTYYADREPELVRASGTVAESVLWLLVRPEMKRSRRVAAVHKWLAELIGSRFGARGPDLLT